MPRRHSSPRSNGQARAARRRLSIGGWLAIVATGLVICSSLTAYAAYQNIYGNITQESVDTDEFGDRPSKVNDAVNILLIGSDKRSGENAKYGDAEGERPDTLAIAHLSPNKETATVVNIPRDSTVDLPQCDATEGNKGQQPHQGLINESMSGGVQCVWKTVEKLTKVHIDHFVSVDFTGFKGMVDAIGGVPMCIPEPINDKDAGHLKLKAGKQTLKGEDALGYVRSRHGQGDGSDLSRIERQQDFMGAMLQKVMSSEVMSSPSSLNGFLGSVTESITTDDELNVSKMSDIAIAMREVDMGKVEFVTTPNGPDPTNPAKVAWKEPDASQLFEAVAKDAVSDGKGKKDKGGKKKDAVDPSEVSVEIVNATSIPGLAQEVSTGLSDKGFQVAGTGNPQSEAPQQTTVYYGEGQDAKAKAVADKLTNATTEKKAGLGDSVQLVLSNDWDGFKGGSGGGGGGGSDALDSADSKSAKDAKVDCG